MVKMADRTNNAAEDRAREQLSENVREITEQGRRSVGKVAAESRDMAGKVAADGRDLLERSSQAAQATGNSYLHLWAEVGGEQLRFNMETLSRMAQAKSLPELISIQGDYVVQTMSRLSQVMTRQLDTIRHLPSPTAR